MTGNEFVHCTLDGIIHCKEVQQMYILHELSTVAARCGERPVEVVCSMRRLIVQAGSLRLAQGYCVGQLLFFLQL